jgi:tRNA uridine 5-carboxymethylaminomethyl modification enzyme
LRRPDVELGKLLPVLRDIHPEVFTLLTLDDVVVSQTEIQTKYAAYIEKELQQIERVRQMEHARIPPSMDYSEVPGFRNEAREKLAAVRPATVGQASRIAGVTPSDVAVLIVHLRNEDPRRSNRSVQRETSELAATNGD